MAWNSRPDYGNNRDAPARNQESRGGYTRDRMELDKGPQRFPNSGALFPTREKRTQNSPDLYGSILIADDVLDYILREAEGGNEVMLELSAWMKVSRDNTSITSIKINIPYRVRQEQEGNQTFRRPGYDNRPRQMDMDNRRLEPSAEQRNEQRNSYREQSSGTHRPSAQEQREKESQRRNEEFSRGDSVPDFLRDD